MTYVLVKTTCGRITVVFIPVSDDLMSVRMLCDPHLPPNGTELLCALLGPSWGQSGTRGRRVRESACTHVPPLDRPQFMCDVMHRVNLAAQAYYDRAHLNSAESVGTAVASTWVGTTISQTPSS
jgi:hypothetical protein